MSADVFREELLPDERVLWSGQPETNVIFSASDIFLVPFSVLWAGFMVFAFYQTLTCPKNNVDMVAYIILLVFFVFGLYIVFGRFIYKTLDKKKTWYAITNKRVIIIKKLVGSNIKAVAIDRVDAVNKSINSRGFGNITFGNQSGWGGYYRNSGMEFFNYHGPEAPAFYDIKEADKAYDVFKKLQNKV